MERKIVERLLLGDGLNRICRELGVSKRRVIMVRAKADEAGYIDGRQSLPPYPEAIFPETEDGRGLRSSPTWEALLPYREWIRERLLSGWHAITVWEELPIKVPRSSFYRFLIRYRLNELSSSLRRVVPEIVHAPAEALLIDWAYLWKIERDGRKEKLWAFIAILGYSRFMVVRLMTRCDTERTLAVMRDIYETLGGVPFRTTSDNPKVFALKANKYEPLLNPAYERFASHYGTLIECLAPREPQQKGKVERPVPYLRRLLEAYLGDRNDIEALQEYLNKKLVIANERRHGTTNERPVDRFLKEEQPLLKPLPIIPHEPEHYHEGTVRFDGHVRFQGKYYSVDEKFVRKEVSVIGNSKLISIYHAGKLIEVHDRNTDRNRSKSTKPQHRKPWERACENPDGLKEIARKVGPAVEAFVTRILHFGDGFIDFRKIWGILSLDKKYSPTEINAACEFALEFEDLSYHTVVRQIEAARVAPIVDEAAPTRPSGKFQRSLSEYKQLLLSVNKGETYEH